MQIDLATLPDDTALLQSLLRDVVTAAAQQQGELHAENDKLRLLIQRLLRHRFGRRSEQLDPDQLQFGLEDLEQAMAEGEAVQDAATQSEEQRQQRRAARPRRNHGALPAHLPRYEVVIDVNDKACPCCSGALHLIGEDRSEQLDIIPAQLRVRVTRRPRYGCRACEGTVVQAPAPERPIDGGMATEALVAHIVVAKFCDHLPLYRQAGMLARQGVTLDRSTLASWVGRACWWLTPLYDLVVSTVLSSPKLFADDTTLPVLDPGRGRTKTGRLWCYTVEDRPWCGPGHPAAAYVYSEDRKGEWPAGHLAGFRGVLQVDGYAGFKRLAGNRADGSVRLAFCWAHMRRPFYEFYVSTESPLAAEVLARIRELYAIEAEIRGHPAEHRRQVRHDRSRPIVDTLHVWLQDHGDRVSAASDLAKAIRYAIRHWDGLAVFLDDGRVEMDTNVVECAIRPNTLTRKNALFAGSDGGARHWAIAMTLIQTAKLNGVEPRAYLTDILQRVVSGRTKTHELHSLLPWNWRPNDPPILTAAARLETVAPRHGIGRRSNQHRRGDAAPLTRHRRGAAHRGRAWARSPAQSPQTSTKTTSGTQDISSQRENALARRFMALVRGCGVGRRTAADADPIAELTSWLIDAQACGVRLLATFAAGIEQDAAAVHAALTMPWSSGQAEGQITRLKLLTRQSYGRARLDLLRQRVLLSA